MTAARILSDDLLPVLLWSALCFVAGVAYAAYRAVTWVERIRAWAHNEPDHFNERSIP